jgi:predicted ATPase/DNA-binding winged helix-turn-helix (wHTH) protein
MFLNFPKRAMAEVREKTFSFGDFELSGAKRTLLKGGELVALNSKTFDLLLALVENHGQILTKDEILDKVWEGQFVEENNLTVQISALRKILGEKKDEHQFIATITGKGYKFVHEIRQNADNSLAKAAAPPAPTATGIIGREMEIAEIKDWLRRGERLITLTGAGGSGKTALARAASDEMRNDFSDGAFFVELAAVSQTDALAGAIAQKLGIKESGEKTLLESLKDFLRERAVLLVLDNFEQIVSAAFLPAELLESAANLQILVTSRTPLHLKPEREKQILPLVVPPPGVKFSVEEFAAFASVRLFAVRAKAARGGFALSEENAAVVADICRRLDGLPLAVELAAARVRLLSPSAILERLEKSLDLLTGGAKDLPSRQRTMRGAIEWSYELLDADEQRLFRQLAVFAGGFTVETAEFVAGSEQRTTNDGRRTTDILNLLDSLIDNNLLVSNELPNGDVRLQMLEVVREFAFEMLEKSGEIEDLRRVHAQIFLELAEKAEPFLQGEESGEWFAKLEREHDNLRAALAWFFETDSETAVRMAVALRFLWTRRNHFSEGKKWLNSALAQSEAAEHTLRFKILHALGVLLRVQGDYEAAAELYQRGLSEGEKAKDWRQITVSSSCLGGISYLLGDYAAARKYLQQGLAISRELKDEYSIAFALAWYAIVAGIEGKSDEARRYLEESLVILRKMGDKEAVSNTLNNLGSVAFDQGDYEASQEFFTEGLEISQEVGNKVNIIDALNGFAALAERRKNPSLAAKIAGAAQNLSDSIEYKKEPAELKFCDEYIAKIRGALDEKTFLEAFETGRALQLSESVSLVKSFDTDYETEILIETHQISHIIIEELD